VVTLLRSREPAARALGAQLLGAFAAVQVRQGRGPSAALSSGPLLEHCAAGAGPGLVAPSCQHSARCKLDGAPVARLPWAAPVSARGSPGTCSNTLRSLAL